MNDLWDNVQAPLEVYQLSAKQMDASIQSVTDKAAVLEVMINETIRSFEEKIMRTSLELSTAGEETESRILGTMDTNINNVKQELQLKITDNKNVISDLSTRINAKVEMYHNELIQLDKDHYLRNASLINSYYDSLSDRITTINSNLSNAIELGDSSVVNFVKDISTKLKTYTDAKISSTIQKLNDTSSAIVTYFNGKVNNINGSIGTIKSSVNLLTNNLYDTSTTLKTDTSRLDKKIDDVSIDLNSLITGVRNDLNETRDALATGYESFFGTVAQGLAENLNTSLAGAISEFKDWCSSTANYIDQTVTDHVDDVSLKMAAHIQDISTYIRTEDTSLFVDYTAKFSRVETAIHKIMDEIQSMDLRLQKLERLGGLNLDEEVNKFKSEGLANIVLQFIDLNRDLNDLVLQVRDYGSAMTFVHYYTLSDYIIPYSSNHSSTLRLPHLNDEILAYPKYGDKIYLSMFSLSNAGFNAIKKDDDEIQILIEASTNTIFDKHNVNDVSVLEHGRQDMGFAQAKISGYYNDSSNNIIQFSLPETKQSLSNMQIPFNASVKEASKYNGRIFIEIQAE